MNDIDRRLFLASLGASGALAACGGARTMLPGSTAVTSAVHDLFHPSAAGTLPLQIVNLTGIADNRIWFYVVGEKALNTLPWFHMTKVDGTLVQCSAKDGGATGMADYSINLSAVPNRTIQLPTLFSGRMYFSVDKKLKIPIGANAIPDSPSGWSYGGANYDTLFDWWEFVNEPGGSHGFNPNTTAVDMMGLPMQIRGVGHDEGGNAVDLRTGYLNGVRTKILDTLRKTPSWKNLVIGNLRAISVNQALGKTSGKNGPLFTDANYFQKYIADVWTYYKTNKLNAVISYKGKDLPITGKVGANGLLTFTGIAGLAPISFKLPTTLKVLECQMQSDCAVGSACFDASEQLRGGLNAAFNRTTLLKVPWLGVIPEGPSSGGCKKTIAVAYQNPQTNWYAKVMHENSIAMKQYGFGLDDNCAQSGFFAIRKPTKGWVTLLKF